MFTTTTTTNTANPLKKEIELKAFAITFKLGAELS